MAVKTAYVLKRLKSRPNSSLLLCSRQSPAVLKEPGELVEEQAVHEVACDGLAHRALVLSAPHDLDVTNTNTDWTETK
jgi:hypothetical protein